MSLKNELAYQMYLDVLDILEKNNYSVKTEKGSANAKNSIVFSNNKPCGKVCVVSAPPKNRESSMYALSAHAKLIVSKESIRNEYKDNNFAEGTRSDEDGCLWYFGYGISEWVALVDSAFEQWREKSPLYLKTVEEMEKLKKKKPETYKEFDELEKEFEKLAAEFTGISFYRNSPELAGECKKHVTGLREELYQATLKEFKKLNANSAPSTAAGIAKIIQSYESVLVKFNAIKDFDDSAEKIKTCEKELEKYSNLHDVTAYKEAIAELSALESRPEKESYFEYAYRYRHYRRIAKKLKEISYENSKELRSKCKKQYKSYGRKVSKKLLPILLISIVVILIVVFLYFSIFDVCAC